MHTKFGDFQCVQPVFIKTSCQPVATNDATACNWLPLVQLRSKQNPKVPQLVASKKGQKTMRRPKARTRTNHHTRGL